ncbi:MAG TPA: hypothetical protein VGJ04_01535, partial [Pirellulales bacterium]
MSEQSGNDPSKRVPQTGTVHLARGEAGDESRLAPTQADPGGEAGNQPTPERTLPINSAELAQSAAPRAATTGSVAGQAQVGGASQTAASGTRFRHLQSWREGGLGKVYIALDEELHREVALKEIKPQYAGNRNSQERFLLEGEITGSLEHPGIVPVYGMGRYSDGRPYYAMRFVHGESLEEA